MRYKITITEETQELQTVGKKWKQGADPDNGTEGWGHTPEIKTVMDVTREIYAQNVDTLDLKAVIKAINGL